jgi:hypothetical protein
MMIKRNVMNKFQKFLARFLIPKGYYCHGKNNCDICPFWSLDLSRPYHENGYCSYLGKGDWDINDEYPEYITIIRKQDDGNYKNEIVNKNESPIYGQFSLLWDKCKECNVK